jgi:hypothetical protein
MYKILTEDVNRDGIFAILDSYVEGYTVTPSIGAWRGRRENSLAIDLVDVPRGTVAAIAETIRAANKQESVLILEFASVPTFVSAVPFWPELQIDGAHLTHRGNPE